LLPAQTNFWPRLAVSTIFFINGATWGTWVSHLNEFKEQYSVGDGLLSVALFAGGVGAVCAMPIAGRLCARFGSRMVVSQTIAPVCLGLSLLPFAPNIVLFSLCLLFYGFVSSIMDVSMNAHAVLVERACKRPIMSTFHGFFSAGGMAGGLLGSLSVQCALKPAIQLPLVGAVLFIAGVKCQKFLFPTELDKQGPKLPDSAQRRAWKLDSIIIGLALIALSSFVSEGAMGDWTAIYLHGNLGTSESFAALGFAAFNVSMCIGRFCGDAVVHCFGSVRSVRCGALLAVCGLTSALTLNNPLFALFGFAAVGLGLSTVVPNVFTAAGNSSESAGMGIATVAIVGYLGLLLGPPIIGFTADAIGLGHALGLVLGLEALILLLASCLKPRDTSERQAAKAGFAPSPDILN
jgi:MFS family permease